MTLQWSRSGTHYGKAGRRNLGLCAEASDDPVRHERLAAIGRMGHRFAFIKRMTFYFVYLSDRKMSTLNQKRYSFRPLISAESLFVTLLTIAQMAKI